VSNRTVWKMYMLDTDTVSFAPRGQGRVGTRLLEHRPSELCISSIALAELRFGAEARRSRSRRHQLEAEDFQPGKEQEFRLEMAHV